MGCNYCLNNLREPELISREKTEENSPWKNNTNTNSLYKETITTSQNGKESNENKKKKKIPKKILTETKDFFGMEILEEINIYRLKHGVDELIYDEKISKISQKYAEKCAREKELELSENKYNNEDLGEIIFCYKNELTPKDVVDIWYNHGSHNYNYNKEPEISNDFTQLIWKNSKLFGLGHAITKENKNYIVANFFPQGNIKGQFLKNVFPLINQSETNSVYSIHTKFLEEILNSHNELRLKHNSPPLILSPNLSTLAQKKVEEMAKKEIKNYKNEINKNNYGINYFISKNNCTGDEVTSFWYEGINKYNFKNKENKNKNDEMINSFTQLIWKNTKEVGFGYSNDDKGNFYVVAYYFPCGNIKGKYKDNVFPSMI